MLILALHEKRLGVFQLMSNLEVNWVNLDIWRMCVEDTGRFWTILEDFGKLSGLECNVEKERFVHKQCSTRIHRRNWFFCSLICNHQDLQIEGDNGSFNKSCEKICTQVRNNNLVCKRFNLSLPGWICNAKTMLYSQLNYFQHFIDIPK